MKQELTKLKEYREKVEELTTKFNEAKTKFEEENKQIIEELYSTKKITDNLEEEIKQKAIEQYKSTDEKNFDGGVFIRLNKRAEYSNEDAMTWALENKRCLMLDTSEFKKVIKEFNLPFVNEVEMPSVVIPSKIKLDD